MLYNRQAQHHFAHISSLFRILPPRIVSNPTSIAGIHSEGYRGKLESKHTAIAHQATYVAICVCCTTCDISIPSNDRVQRHREVSESLPVDVAGNSRGFPRKSNPDDHNKYLFVDDSIGPNSYCQGQCRITYIMSICSLVQGRITL